MIVCLNLCIEYVDVFVYCSFTHWLLNFLNCSIPTLGTHHSRVQWTCLPYLVSHRLHASIVTMPKFSRFSVNQPLENTKLQDSFGVLYKHKKQNSNVPRIVFPCFSTISSSFRSKIIPPKIWNKFMFVRFPPEKTVAKHWLSSILEVAKWRPWSTWRRRGSFQPVLRIWRILEFFRVEAKVWWLM